MEDIIKILEEFVKECSKKLTLYSILQFGSSTNSKNFDDVDLMFVFNEKVFSSKNLLDLRKIILEFEKKYPEVLFDFGGVATRKRKTKYEITVVLSNLSNLKMEHNPHDLFFYKNLLLDDNKKFLFGKDFFEEFSFQFTNKHMLEMLSLDVIFLMRNSLDDEHYLFKRLYFTFKTFLRAMLTNKGHFKKKELLEKFKENFGKDISLPKNHKKIINNEIKKEDLKDILNFCNACLEYLNK